MLLSSEKLLFVARLWLAHSIETLNEPGARQNRKAPSHPRDLFTCITNIDLGTLTEDDLLDYKCRCGKNSETAMDAIRFGQLNMTLQKFLKGPDLEKYNAAILKRDYDTVQKYESKILRRTEREGHIDRRSNVILPFGTRVRMKSDGKRVPLPSQRSGRLPAVSKKRKSASRSPTEVSSKRKCHELISFSYAEIRPVMRKERNVATDAWRHGTAPKNVRNRSGARTEPFASHLTTPMEREPKWQWCLRFTWTVIIDVTSRETTRPFERTNTTLTDINSKSLLP